MRVPWISLISFVPFAAACSVVPEPPPTDSGETPPASPASPASPEVAAHFEPGDLFTSVGDTPPSIVVRWQDGEPGAERLDAVAEALSLSTYPEGEPVPAQIERRAEGEEEHAARLLLRPEAPLEDRWYVLRLAPVPEGVSIVGDATTTPGGAAGVRFRPGAEVVTRRVTACGGVDGGVVLTATLSERVAVPEGKQAMRVRQGGALLECAWFGSETPPEEKGHAATVGEIRVRCAGAAAGAPLEITLAGEIRTHRLLGAFRPAPAGAAPDRPADDEGCEVLRP